ncbi:MAG: hypothetical protein M1825_004064 [Sarcosagium campestre]|nr:MAG: hypothetical protein M1825_004064 [Sarcosagium campestre]
MAEVLNLRGWCERCIKYLVRDEEVRCERDAPGLNCARCSRQKSKCISVPDERRNLVADIESAFNELTRLSYEEAPHRQLTAASEKLARRTRVFEAVVIQMSRSTSNKKKPVDRNQVDGAIVSISESMHHFARAYHQVHGLSLPLSLRFPGEDDAVEPNGDAPTNEGIEDGENDAVEPKGVAPKIEGTEDGEDDGAPANVEEDTIAVEAVPAPATSAAEIAARTWDSSPPSIRKQRRETKLARRTLRAAQAAAQAAEAKATRATGAELRSQGRAVVESLVVHHPPPELAYHSIYGRSPGKKDRKKEKASKKASSQDAQPEPPSPAGSSRTSWSVVESSAYVSKYPRRKVVLTLDANPGFRQLHTGETEMYLIDALVRVVLGGSKKDGGMIIGMEQSQVTGNRILKMVEYPLGVKVQVGGGAAEGRKDRWKESLQTARVRNRQIFNPDLGTGIAADLLQNNPGYMGGENDGSVFARRLIPSLGLEIPQNMTGLMQLAEYGEGNHFESSEMQKTIDVVYEQLAPRNLMVFRIDMSGGYSLVKNTGQGEYAGFRADGTDNFLEPAQDEPAGFGPFLPSSGSDLSHLDPEYSTDSQGDMSSSSHKGSTSRFPPNLSSLSLDSE